MGLFGGGEKKEKKDPKEIYGGEVEKFLLDDENIEEIYPLILDFLCFTNKRIIFVDKNISFKEPKTVITSIPYSKVDGFGLVKNEKAFSFTDELILNTKARDYNLKFIKNTNLQEVYNKIAEKIL